MKINKFFIGVLSGAILFSGPSFGMQPQQGSIMDSVKDIADKIANVTLVVGGIIILTPLAALVLLGASRKTADVFYAKVGPYLPMDFSYFKQMESGLQLIKPEKDQKGLVYSVDDCLQDIAKIIVMYDEVGPIYTGKVFKKYHRDRAIKHAVLDALFQKYELFLPKNITKQDWMKYSKKYDLWLGRFERLSKRYKNNQELQQAIGELDELDRLEILRRWQLLNQQNV